MEYLKKNIEYGIKVEYDSKISYISSKNTLKCARECPNCNGCGGMK